VRNTSSTSAGLSSTISTRNFVPALRESSVEMQFWASADRLPGATWTHSQAAVPASRESAVEERELRTVDNFSVIQTSILSNLSSFKQRTPSELSGENGQQRHYSVSTDIRIAMRQHADLSLLPLACGGCHSCC
jgi:hypothetical protein